MATKPCIICGTELQAILGSWEFQTNDGIVCESQGNYGSTKFDGYFDGDVLYFNICDPCLVEAGERERIFTTRVRRPVKTTFEGHETTIGWEKLDRPTIPWHDHMSGWLPDDEVYVEPEEVGTDLPNVEWFEWLVPYVQEEVRTSNLPRV